MGQVTQKQQPFPPSWEQPWCLRQQSFNYYQLTKIRTYRALIAFFFAMVLAMYAKQDMNARMADVYAKPQQHTEYACALSLSSTLTQAPTERLSMPSFVLKKLSFPNALLKSIPALFCGRNNRPITSVNIPYTSIPSLLEMVCILRI